MTAARTAVPTLPHVTSEALGDSCELSRLHEAHRVHHEQQLDDHETRIRLLERASIRAAVIVSLAGALGSLIGGGLIAYLVQAAG